ncbi:Ig-like domain-containing protein [Granulosicoccaceae sp. 1_MG-2023]|nr:Ig-like domain-containing protein [Granulosicoccaceae sp. 1_MG-2023]
MRSDLTRAGAVLSLLLLLGACDSNESGMSEFLQADEVAGLGISAVSVTLEASLVNAGQSFQASASGSSDSGDEYDLTDTVTWESSDDSVAQVDDSGTVTAVADGSASIVASLAGLEASQTLTVRTADLTALELNVEDEYDECLSTPLMGVGTYSDGSTRELLDSPTWSSSDTNLAWIDKVGDDDELVLHHSGAVTVTATLDGVSASQDVTILDTLSGLTISPDETTVTVDETQQYTATGSWTDGASSDITLATRWSTLDTDIASFSDSEVGELTANEEGSTTVSAVCGGLTATTGVTAEELQIDSIYIYSSSSNSITLDTGDDGYELTLWVAYTDGTVDDVTDDAEWSEVSPGSSYISVGNSSSNKGELSISGSDSVYIEAEYEGYSDYILVIVD